jgi:NADH-quinone oxidoreductase subunit D
MATDVTAPRTMILNMGPQHPSTHGVLRVVLELDGETVLRAQPDVGYLHTGIEKTAENKMWSQAVTLTDRVDYLCPMVNNLCYCLAVEKLLGLEPPPKAQWMRVLLAELTRLNSHLVWLGTHAIDIGAMSVFLYCFREREELLKIFEMASGQRMMTSYIRIGGLALEPPLGFFERVRQVIALFPSRIDEYENLLTENPIWKERTQGVGAISLEDAIDLGMTGPTLRACGLAWDIRKAEPYTGYDRFDFEIPTLRAGDVYSRYLVRIAEMRQSVRIVEQALHGMPAGRVTAEAQGVVLPDREKMKTQMEALIYHFKIVTEGFRVPAGEVVQKIESPRGEMAYYIVSDGGTHPYRCFIRGPSFGNLQGVPKLVEGALLADVISSLGSIDFVLGDVDR